MNNELTAALSTMTANGWNICGLHIYDNNAGFSVDVRNPQVEMGRKDVKYTDTQAQYVGSTICTFWQLDDYCADARAGHLRLWFTPLTVNA